MQKQIDSLGMKATKRSGNGAPRTLAVDVGGSGIKAQLLDARGKAISERARIETPKKAKPKEVVSIIEELARGSDDYARVSVGFPGVTKDGMVYTAPNLGSGWEKFELANELERKLGRPVRVANDADVQGLGCVAGKGI